MKSLNEMDFSLSNVVTSFIKSSNPDRIKQVSTFLKFRQRIVDRLATTHKEFLIKQYRLQILDAKFLICALKEENK